MCVQANNSFAFHDLLGLIPVDYTSGAFHQLRWITHIPASRAALWRSFAFQHELHVCRIKRENKSVARRLCVWPQAKHSAKYWVCGALVTGMKTNKMCNFSINWIVVGITHCKGTSSCKWFQLLVRWEWKDHAACLAPLAHFLNETPAHFTKVHGDTNKNITWTINKRSLLGPSVQIYMQRDK